MHRKPLIGERFTNAATKCCFFGLERAVIKPRKKWPGSIFIWSKVKLVIRSIFYRWFFKAEAESPLSSLEQSVVLMLDKTYVYYLVNGLSWRRGIGHDAKLAQSICFNAVSQVDRSIYQFSQLGQVVTNISNDFSCRSILPHTERFGRDRLYLWERILETNTANWQKVHVSNPLNGGVLIES